MHAKFLVPLFQALFFSGPNTVIPAHDFETKNVSMLQTRARSQVKKACLHQLLSSYAFINPPLTRSFEWPTQLSSIPTKLIWREETDGGMKPSCFIYFNVHNSSTNETNRHNIENNEGRAAGAAGNHHVSNRRTVAIKQLHSFTDYFRNEKWIIDQGNMHRVTRWNYRGTSTSWFPSFPTRLYSFHLLFNYPSLPHSQTVISCYCYPYNKTMKKDRFSILTEQHITRLCLWNEPLPFHPSFFLTISPFHYSSLPQSLPSSFVHNYQFTL